jgi:hypothetical protein
MQLLQHESAHSANNGRVINNKAGFHGASLLCIFLLAVVIPAKAGIYSGFLWTPAFAGVTELINM